MTDIPLGNTITGKTIRILIVAVILTFVWHFASFELAVLFGIAMNSADLNELRERAAGLYDD